MENFLFYSAKSVKFVLLSGRQSWNLKQTTFLSIVQSAKCAKKASFQTPLKRKTLICEADQGSLKFNYLLIVSFFCGPIIITVDDQSRSCRIDFLAKQVNCFYDRFITDTVVNCNQFIVYSF